MRVVLPASMWAMIEMLRSAEMGCFSACGRVASATCHGWDELKERVLRRATAGRCAGIEWDDDGRSDESDFVWRADLRTLSAALDELLVTLVLKVETLLAQQRATLMALA